MPEISIITPVWNGADTIGDCMRSISKQTVKCQHVLVDGASTDSTLDIVRLNQPSNIKIISEPDRGMYDAINKGLEEANGNIVGILNADDYYPNNEVLAKVTEVFADPEVDACYGDLLYVNREDTSKVTRNWHSGAYNSKKFYSGWMPPHPTFFIRRSLYREHGVYRLDLGSAADYELMLRMLLKHQANVIYIHKVLVHMRNAGMSNVNIRNRIQANLFDRQAWRVNGIRPKPWTLIAKPLGKLGQWLHFR